MKLEFGLPKVIEDFINERYNHYKVEKDADKVMKKNTLPCPLCQRRTDVLFPSGKIKLCEKCANRIFNQSDVPYRAKKIFEISGEKCYYCGETFYVGYEVETYICNRCTEKIGEREKEIQEFHLRQMNWGVRKLP